MKNSILTFLFAIATCFCFGQITVQVKQNPTPNLSTWENRENIVTVTVNNRGPDIEARFNSIIKLDGATKASTNLEQMPMVTIERGINRFAIDEVMPYRAVTVSDVNAKNMARTGQLPAGNYELCVSLFDEGGKPLPTFHEACGFFLLTQVQLPILIGPFDNQVLRGNVRPTFSWTPATPVSPGTRVTYKLQVFEIMEGQGMMQALQGNRPLISEEVEGLTQYWPTEWDIPNNSSFVWTVQALDDNGNPLGDNNGIAAPQAFKIDKGGMGGNKAADGEPWTQCLSQVCHIKGVKLELYVPSDAITTGSTTYKVASYSINIQYYATASQVLAEFGTTGASEVSDWIGYISSASGITYCDKNGHLIVDQIVYEVTKTNPNDYYGETNELHASGACFNYGTYTALATHFNSHKGSTDNAVPTSCVEGCVGGGGIDPDHPGGGGGTNAAGQEIDDITLDPIDGDGGVSPGGGGLIGHDAAPAEIANPGIIWVDNAGQGFKPYLGGDVSIGKKEFVKCTDGNYCEIKRGSDCCPKTSTTQIKPVTANKCSCEINGAQVTILTTDDCSKVCASFKTKTKEHGSGLPSGKRMHKPIKY